MRKPQGVAARRSGARTCSSAGWQSRLATQRRSLCESHVGLAQVWARDAAASSGGQLAWSSRPSRLGVWADELEGTRGRWIEFRAGLQCYIDAYCVSIGRGYDECRGHITRSGLLGLRDWRQRQRRQGDRRQAQVRCTPQLAGQARSVQADGWPVSDAADARRLFASPRCPSWRDCDCDCDCDCDSG